MMSRRSALTNLNQVLLLLVLTFVVLHYAKAFLVPVAIAGLFAMMLTPVCNWLEGRRVNRGLAAALSVLSTLLILGAVSYVLINQIIVLSKDAGLIAERLTNLLEEAYTFILDHFHYPIDKQKIYLEKQLAGLSDAAGGYVGGLFMSVMDTLVNVLIVTTYTVMFLIYRGRIMRFVLMLVAKYGRKNDLTEVEGVVDKVTGVANAYLSGVFLVVAILSVVYTIGLSLIGIENALFFALLAALINVIPYLGSVGGAIIVLVYTLITRDTLATPIAVVLFFTAVQQVDSYFLTPKITGSMVQLSPLFTIMALLLGALVWGLPGMILFVPFMGVLKVIFDHVDALKPYGYLIGEK